MIYTFRLSLLLLSFLIVLNFSCKRRGCMDSEAMNYEPRAKRNDGSCLSYGYVQFFVDSSCKYYVKNQVLLDSTTLVLDGDTLGHLFELYKGSSPECVKHNPLVGKRYPGFYDYVVSDECNTWTGNVEITSEGCLSVFLRR